MPSITNPNRGSSYSAPRYKAPRTPIGSSQPMQSAGKVEFGLEQKPEEIVSAFGALAQAAVGITAGVAQSIPLIGKPITGAIGAVATGISEIGIPGFKVKDIANVPIKAAEVAGNVGLGIISAPGKLVERGVAQLRVSSNNGDGIKDLPENVKAEIGRGDYIKAGNLLFESNRTYGEGLGALGLSVLLDPLTYIPFGVAVKPFTVAGRAVSTAAKFGIGASKAEIAAKMASTAAQEVIKESVNAPMWERLAAKASNLQRVAPNGVTSSVGRQIVTENINRTLSGVERAAAQSRYANDTLLSAEQATDQIVDQIAIAVGTKLSPAAKEKALTTLRTAFNDIFPDDPKVFDNVIADVERGVDEDTLIKIKRQLSYAIQERGAVREIAERGASNILRSKIDNFSKELKSSVSKIISDSKQDLEYLIKDADEAERLVTNWLKDGLRSSADEVKPLVDDIVGMVRNGSRDDALNALEFARQQGYGQYRSAVVSLRNSAGEYSQEIQDTIQRLTIASQRSLDDAVEEALKQELKSAIPEAKGEILRRYVLKYDELFARFGYTPVEELSEKKILDYIKNSNVKIERIPQGFVNKLPASVQRVAAQLREAGYELSFAPKEGYRELTDVFTGIDGTDTVAKIITPWADLADDFPSRIALSTAESMTQRKSAMMRIFDTLVSEPSARHIRQRSYEKFVLNGIQSGISRGEARELWVAISNAARREEVTVRGLIGKAALIRGTSTIDDIARSALGREAYERLARSAGGYDSRVAFKMILKSLNGDLKDIGILPKISASVKDRLPGIMMVTDYAYPTLRFGYLNPYFRYILENIEPEFFRALRGAHIVKRDALLEEAKSSIISRALINERSVIREFGDAQVAMSRANLHSAADITRRNPGFMGALERLFDNKAMRSIKDVGGRKRRAFEQIASRDAAENWVRDWASHNPQLMDNLVKFYNTSDPYELAYNISLDLVLRDDPLAAAKYMDDLIGQTVATRLANASPEIKNAFYNASEAYRYSFFKGAKKARRSIYYEEEIPFWVRSLNHPFLAVYPLSYMVTKIIPEFVEALFVRVPFIGTERLGVGYNAYQSISEQLAMELEYGDGGLLKFFKENPDFAYLINTLLPGVPSQLGFGISANMRNNIINPGLRGEGVQWDSLITGVGDQFFRGTVGGQLNVTMRAIENLGNTKIQVPMFDLENNSPVDALQTKN